MFAYHRRLGHSVLEGRIAWGCRINEITNDGNIHVDWFDGNPSHRLVGNKSVWRALEVFSSVDHVTHKHEWCLQIANI